MKYVKSLEEIKKEIAKGHNEGGWIYEMERHCGKPYRPGVDGNIWTWDKHWLEERTDVAEIQAEIEKAEKALTEAKAKLETLNNPKVESYPCVTPVDEEGDIVFNNGLQILHVEDSVYAVTGTDGEPTNEEDFR